MREKSSVGKCLICCFSATTTARARSFVLALVCRQLDQPAAVVVTICLSGGRESSPLIHTLCLLSFRSPCLKLSFLYFKHVSVHRLWLSQLKGVGTGKLSLAGGYVDRQTRHLHIFHRNSPKHLSASGCT